MARLGAVVSLLALIGPFAMASRAQEPQLPAAQFRAYWVDSFGPGLYTEAEIDQLVAETRAANLNAIVAQVVRRADCLCNRSMMPRTEAEIDPYPFDPLQTLIEKAHAAGIEVHAWLNAGIMWAGDVPPRDPDHVFHAHGPAAADAETWVSRRFDGASRGGNLYFFDPGHPAAADYIVEMYLSIVRNYDVDGINLDYIRYPDFNPGESIPAWGYTPVAVARFQAISGRSDLPDPTDPEWVAWRREQITGIVRRIYLESYAINPLLRVSADTVTYGTISGETEAWLRSRPYREVLQDWRAWMEEGIIDLNIPMNYRREPLPPPPGQPSMFGEWSRFAVNQQHARQVAIGTALYLNPVEDSIAQIRQALAPRPDGTRASGWVGFSYRTPDLLVNQRRRSPEYARADLARALTTADPDPGRAPLFGSPAVVPPMSWKLAPSTGHIHGAIVTSQGTPADQVPVNLHDAATGAHIASRPTTGSGWFGFVDLRPGAYAVAAGAATAAITVTAGRITPVALVLPP